MYGWLKRACGCAYRRAARFASRRALVCAALAAGAFTGLCAQLVLRRLPENFKP